MAQNTFVGRDYEQTLYKEFLSKETPWLLLITGLAGIGKTTLLEKFRTLTPFDIQVVSLDFDKEPLLYADPLKLLEDLAQLTKSFCDQQESAEFVETLKQGRTQIEELDQQTSPIIHDSERASVQVLQKVRHLRSALQEVRHQVRELAAEAFFTQLDTYKQKQLVIMLDTCELLYEPEGWEVGQWMMNEFLPTLNVRMYQRCFVVMASRVPLQSETIDKQDQQYLALSMLDRPAVDQYLETLGMHDPQLRQRVYEITHGHALSISIISTFWQEMGEKVLGDGDISVLEAEFDDRASVEFINDRILNRLNDPFKELTHYAVLLRNFNLPLLKAVFPELLPEQLASNLFDQFIHFPYIEAKGNYRYGFHELIREVLAKNTQKDHPVEWKRYHKRALNYFDSNAGKSREMEHSQEWYYHAIAYDEAQGIRDWKEAIEKARMGGLGKEIGSLLQVVYDKTLTLSPISCAIRAYEQGRFEDDNAQSERALKSYEEALVLFRQAGSHPKEEADVVQALGDVQRSRTKLDEALTLYEQAFALFQEVGDSLKQAYVLKALGDVQRLLGNQNNALSSYRQALSLFRRIGNRLDEANVLQAIGDVQQLLGNLNAALESYKQALVLFRQFGSGSKEEKDEEAKLLRFIGDLHQLRDDKEKALENYQQALVLFRGNATEEEYVQQAIRGVEYPALTPSNLNRQRLLTRVHTVWIAGVLEQSLHGAALIALGFHEQFDAVANPWRMVLQTSDQSAPPLPSDTRIIQLYDEAGGELLILGEPGSGKTTLLLELTRDLLDRARQVNTHPMPVVFILSSWAEKRQPLTDWLVEELSTKYQVPRTLGQLWVASDQMLLLLDGLDEVAPAHRAVCIDAINEYRREHGLVPTVICSRIAEYLSLATRLQLRQAVVVQPLTEQQIDDYLSSAGGQLEAVRIALRDDPSLRELAATPLMLSVLTLAYYGKPIENILVTGSPERRRREVFASYVQRMLRRRSTQTRYTVQQTVHWLAWLAKQLAQHGQTVFYIERMQPNWLPDNRSRQVYHIAISLLVGLVFGLLGGLVGGLVFGLLGGLVGGLTGKMETEIRPAEVIAWSWASIRRGLSRSVVFGLVFGLLVGMVSWFFYETISRLAVGLVVGLIVGLVFGLVNGLSSEMLEEHNLVIPNQGIRRSAQNSILLGLFTGLFVGLAFGLIYNLGSGLIFGLFFGLIYWLRSGGLAVIQHMILRLLLWRARYLPSNYPRFLDYAAERILLRKVGGGYIFVHRLLLEYFASLDNTSISAEETTQIRQVPPSS